jgi:hypothetical protein
LLDRTDLKSVPKDRGLRPGEAFAVACDRHDLSL